MNDEVIGKVVSGSVTNVANFGAFVLLEDNQEGLIHISEIANEFISDIHKYIKSGDKVKVKVLARNNKKKLELSLKKAQDADSSDEKTDVPKKRETPIIKKQRNPNFEDKLNGFLKRSEERQIDIRRNLKNKQGISKRKR
jgi:S1 RNA binding domain protein